MSGVVSGITKAFTSVAGTLSTSLGSAVTGVGATVATAGAATGGGLLAQGALKSVVGGLGSGGVLSNIFGGVAKVVGGAGLVGAMSMGAPAIDAAATTAAVGGGMAAGAAPSLMERAGNFLSTESGASLVGGLGKGWAAYEQLKSDEEENQAKRQDLIDKEMRIRDSYDVPGSALGDGASTGVVKDVRRPTPSEQFGGRGFDMVYKKELGQIVPVSRG